MDDVGYESPDSDGHGTIPSPNSTFDYSALRNEYDSRFPSPPPGHYSDSENENEDPNRENPANVISRYHHKSGSWFTQEHGSSPPSNKYDDRSITSLPESAARNGRVSSFSKPVIGEEEYDDDSFTRDCHSPRSTSSNVEFPDPAAQQIPSFVSSLNSLTGLSKRVSVRKHRSSPIKPTQHSEFENNGPSHDILATPTAKRSVGGPQSHPPATPPSEPGPGRANRFAASPVADLPSFAHHAIKRSPWRSVSNATSSTESNEVLEEIDAADIIQNSPRKSAYHDSPRTSDSHITAVKDGAGSERPQILQSKSKTGMGSRIATSNDQTNSKSSDILGENDHLQRDTHSSDQSAKRAGPPADPMDSALPSQTRHSSPSGLAALPKHPYSQSKLNDFRKSSLARRVSISSLSDKSSPNTAKKSGYPNKVPPPLSVTEYRFPPRPWQFGSPSRSQPTEPATEYRGVRPRPGNGTRPPPNTTFNTPSKDAGVDIPADFPKRFRSQSDPMDKKYSFSRRETFAELLLTPTRVPHRRRLIPFSKDITDEFDQQTVSTDDVFGPPQPHNEISFTDNVRMEHLKRQLTDSILTAKPCGASELGQAINAGRSQSQPQFDNSTVASTVTSVSATTHGTRAFQDGTLRRRVKHLESQMGEILQHNYRAEANFLKATNRADELQDRYDKAIAENADKNRTIQALQQRIEALSKTSTTFEKPEAPTTSQDQSEALSQLYVKISALETKISQMRTTTREQLEEKESVIYQLRGALSQADRSEHNRIQELERQLRVAKEDIEIRDAEVRHLQAELDDLANLMPVDQSSRLMFDDANSDAPWINEKSVEFANMIEESMNDIITELHGDPDRDDVDQAAEEAEMSLRKLAKNSGYPELDKISLAAFGIRHMREENIMFQRLLREAQERENQMRLANDELTKRFKQSEESVKLVTKENEHLKSEFQQTKLSFQKEKDLSKSLHSNLTKSTSRIESLTTSLATAQKQLDDLKTTASNADNLESELYHLRTALASSQSQTKTLLTRIKDLEAERDQQIVDLARLQTDSNSTHQRESLMLQTVDEYAKKLADLETLSESRVADINAAENQVQRLRKQLSEEREKNVNLLNELTAVNTAEQSARKQLGAKDADRSSLEEEMKKLNTIVATLRKEKAAAEYNRQKAESDRKLARDKLDVALKELHEKESVWEERIQFSEIGSSNDSSGGTGVREEELAEAVKPYERALTMIAAEVDESSIPDDGDEEMHELVDTLSPSNPPPTHHPKPELVALIIHTLRTLYKTNKELDEKVATLTNKSERLKNGIRAWHEKQLGKEDKMKKLKEERDELILKLKAERRANDEKIGGLILALRRGAGNIGVAGT